MNKIIETDRNFKFLIFAIIHIILYLVIKKSLNIQFELVDQKFTNAATNGGDTYSLYGEMEKIESFFGFLYILSSSIIFYLIIKHYTHILKSIILIFLVIYVWYPFFTLGDLSIPFDEKEYSSLNYYNYLIHFFPYLFLIYDRVIIGKKKDITEIVKKQNEIKHEDVLLDLKNLLKMDLISNDEFEIKKEQKIKDKIRIEIKETDEYLLLSKSKEHNLLSEKEYTEKLELLIDKRYNDLEKNI